MRASMAIIAVLCLAAGPAVSGCARARPAAESERFRGPAEPLYTGTLSPDQQQRVKGAFDALAAGKSAVNHPAAAEGVRWSDLRLAVAYACDDVEAAVVRQTQREWGWEFAIRTVEDWPGTLTVRKTNDQRVYEATAVIGVFGDRKERAAALLDALDTRLRELGRKRKFPDEPDGRIRK